MTVALSLLVTSVEAQNATKDLTVVIKDATSNPTIAKIALNGTNYSELCQSGRCTLEYDTSSSPYVSTPSPDHQFMSYSVDFKIVDQVPQKDIGPKKKAFLEEFSATQYACRIDDIVEENNQELYYCHDDTNTVTRNFDSKSWYYDTTGIFDAKANTLTFIGNYSHS